MAMELRYEMNGNTEGKLFRLPLLNDRKVYILEGISVCTYSRAEPAQPARC
ncbi:hypothetical protein [Bacillus salacetis]|uniref:hypothetical protein n=1 Tax=Bacillus salacetis TaxID=2315464 RepID=UPI0014438E73|nr:hypothetical protein [Bacillus salacetis]